ncbi:leucine-rich repeat domain-containing protein [Undibacterium sp. JH2W]|uniref:leucine-rich repeat domain-containing protein n=1 Tax=Undibacterium sp. JH2W TaxID=3413037 RepID=UPI003BF173A7
MKKKIRLTDDLPKLWEDSRLRGYLGEINRRHGVVDTLALPNMRDLPPIRIENLFVQPMLSNTPVSSSSNPEGWPEGLSLFNTLKSIPRVVLLGDPGSGKTTLVNWLAWRLSGGFTTPLPKILDNCLPIPCVLREMKSNVFNKTVTIADLAVFVAERLFGKKITDTLETSLRAHVANKKYVLILDGVDEIPRNQRSTVAAWMQQAAKDEACALATSRIVGYEDSPICSSINPSQRLIISEAVKSINLNKAQAYDSQITSKFESNLTERLYQISDDDYVQTIKKAEKITADIQRQIGFISQKLQWADIRYLMPFDQQRIAAFVENWYLQRNTSEQEAKKKTGDLIYVLSQSETTQELARTPNLLSLMAIVHRERAHLPDGKALLYKEIANAYINTIDQHRNINIDDALVPFGWETRENWLAYVGFQMQLERDTNTSDSASLDHEKGVLVTQEKVLNWLSDAMHESGVTKSQLSAQMFLDWVARRSGLLLPRGEGQFAFVHLSFQEYFCARYLTSRIVSPKFIKDQLGKNAPVTKEKLFTWSQEAVWHESLIYVLELISGERDSTWVEDLVEILFNTSKRNSDIRLGIVTLAMRVLNDRHIHLSTEWKGKLAKSHSHLVYSGWKYGITGDIDFQNLLRSNYAAIFTSPSKQDEDEYHDLPVRGIKQLKDIQNAPDLFVLIIDSNNVSDLSILKKVNKLIVLSIHAPKLKDISSLSEMRFLEELSLTYLKIQDISALEKINTLKHLEIDFTKVSDISPLKNLRKLQDLSLVQTDVKDIAPIQNLNNLLTLHLAGTKIEDIEPLTGCKKLTSLHLSNTLVKNISALKSLRNLRTLDLSNTLVEDISAIASLKNLRTLRLRNTRINNISSLASLKKLTSLHLEHTSINDLTALSKMTQLRSLYLDNTNITNIKPIANLTDLSILTLSDTAVSDISSISGNRGLEYLKLNSTNIHDISSLTKLENLTRLDMNRTKVTDISGLAEIIQLRHLNLGSTQITDITPLRKLEQLRYINLEGSSVKDFSALNEYVKNDGATFFRKNSKKP